MKYIITLLTLSLLLFATDFIQKQSHSKYKEIDKKFTYEKTTSDCYCGEPAELLPYNGEDIPLANTEPCLDMACKKTFVFEEEVVF